jgi:uncharacterized protein YecA (UPF0149 family)
MTDGFLASPETAALADVPAEARAEIARRLHRALDDIGTPLEKMGATDVHGWLLHAVPEQFGPRDPLAKHVAPVARALLAFTERTHGRELPAVRAACDEMLPELEEALVHGHAHHHHHHDDEDEPPVTYVRETPKVGRNEPCPCGSGKKFKKCHGA